MSGGLFGTGEGHLDEVPFLTEVTITGTTADGNWHRYVLTGKIRATGKQDFSAFSRTLWFGFEDVAGVEETSSRSLESPS